MLPWQSSSFFCVFFAAKNLKGKLCQHLLVCVVFNRRKKCTPSLTKKAKYLWKKKMHDLEVDVSRSTLINDNISPRTMQMPCIPTQFPVKKSAAKYYSVAFQKKYFHRERKPASTSSIEHKSLTQTFIRDQTSTSYRCTQKCSLVSCCDYGLR